MYGTACMSVGGDDGELRPWHSCVSVSVSERLGASNGTQKCGAGAEEPWLDGAGPLEGSQSRIVFGFPEDHIQPPGAEDRIRPAQGCPRRSIPVTES